MHKGGKILRDIKDINIISFNARGLKSKILELESELAVLPNLPIIILICETWFDDTFVFSGDIFKNYDIFHKDRNRHGGVLILSDIELNAIGQLMSILSVILNALYVTLCLIMKDF